MTVLDHESTPALYNDPALTNRLLATWKRALGPDRVEDVDPVMAGEDFARYSLDDHSIPTCLFWLGAVDPEAVKRSEAEGTPLPGLHSPHFAPCAEPAIRTGVKAMYAAVTDLLKK